MTIEIFDGESQFYFGSCKVPLFELLRQGKPVVVRAKECEIFDPEQAKYKGFLSILLSNQGKEPTSRDNGESLPTPVLEDGGKRAQPSQKEGKTRRRIISRPLDFSDLR